MVLVIDIIHPCNLTCYNIFDPKICYEGFIMLSYLYIWWQEAQFLEDDVVQLYLVRDNIYLAWTRWMPYGLCFSRRMNVKPQLRRSRRNQIMKMLWRWSWIILKTKMDAKVEVLSMWSWFQWRNSRINSEVCQEIFKFNIFSKDKVEMHMEHNLSLSTPKGRHVSNSWEKEYIDLAWSKHISSQGGWL